MIKLTVYEDVYRVANNDNQYIDLNVRETTVASMAEIEDRYGPIAGYTGKRFREWTENGVAFFAWTRVEFST